MNGRDSALDVAAWAAPRLEAHGVDAGRLRVEVPAERAIPVVLAPARVGASKLDIGRVVVSGHDNGLGLLAVALQHRPVERLPVGE